MNYIKEETSVVFQELPDHISLTFSITGCGHKCKGCHSPYLQNENNGEELSIEKFVEYIEGNRGYITAVIFFGGEQYDDMLLMLDIARSYKLKTCLYTGNKKVSRVILSKLDFIKTGEFIERLGGLTSATTNQRMVNVATGEDITYKFNNTGELDDRIDRSTT